ncbi:MULTISPECIES: pentapeptide repeat-containing protein [unclassified Microcoleus]|uniref:pentapeptide repeat-containing protein n=1 Tax=unclassified Microcoleus TaxID=2642155 RepID=UPI001DDBEC14|nr:MULTISPECIES: pentapeptide repeat-containing protein [unclassified Microcoleus]MCC3442268.1 pentapeptide repeat-containing protein [Microcoleus sp. PH2017_03_ELD_O_A]MCC3468378.1 pentapeptide repeat-containing protein [Microcoleus sp. PH2017_06_SFM_O_A]MCC3505487.1 pentapeptide repeat-containing protein [Microcoleus sp. PH2017_19_SFW_U_A]TAE10942.1 MAG: pentapeptide repeat-containing protein [Oscillatoriales cyanobacterium]MCC3411982.1 pentapeptide repeat-containing protein [Microcoleus sp.
MDKESIAVEELLRRYVAGDRDFRNIILEYADLSGVELQNIDLTGAQFNYVNLSRVNLHRCKLRSAQFWYCNFTDAKIYDSDLESTRFFDCDLRGANTSATCNLTCARFTRINFQGAKLGGTGEDPCEFRDIIRQDGVFIPGFTFNPYLYSHNTNREV